MVLGRVLVVLACAVSGTGCNQSLFDNRGGGSRDGGNGSADGGADAMIQTSCGANCLGDAAGDFDGTPMGTGNRWRYFDDHRDRTWAAMTPSGGALVGADPANTITTCAAKPTAAACADLPGALLVSTAGMSSNADPAIAFTSTASQVIQLTLRVKIPSAGLAHGVAIYRNSREDRLYLAPAGAGALVETALTVDAVSGDRFYVALVPVAGGTADLAVELYINGTGATFPSTCQLAVPFTAAVGTGVDNACGADLTSWHEGTSTYDLVAPTLTAGPFAEQGMAADLAPDYYYESSDVIARTGDTTLQFWMRHDAFVSGYAAWPYSDDDLNSGGGVGLYLYDTGSTTMLEASCCAMATPPYTSLYVDVSYPTDHAWHFIRLVHVGGMYRLCIDGTRVGSFAAAAGADSTTIHPYIGRNAFWTPQGAFFDGAIDDLRIFSGALPCE